MSTRRVALQLHPDWPSGGGTVMDALTRERRYRSQFVTGTSNGGLTAFPGGDRWRWESRLFAGRYDAAPAAERPVYGALERGGPAQGPAVRFGSSYLRLRPEVVARSTFCFPDSVFEPDLVVGPEGIGTVEEAAARAQLGSLDAGDHLDELDHYVEAHVHGGVDLDHDVEAIVLDPCFRGTSVEQAALGTGCAVTWHPGFRVTTAELDPSYRGEPAVRLARQLGQTLTPADVGAAARSGEVDLQALKHVWHLLARFGRLAGSTTIPAHHRGGGR